MNYKRLLKSVLSALLLMTIVVISVNVVFFVINFIPYVGPFIGIMLVFLILTGAIYFNHKETETPNPWT
jgi:uncharacterized membrane protein